IGNTSVKTACRPRFFRLEGDASAWRKSRYELVCNSIRLGGAMISLILPKLIRSVTRVGIWAFNKWLATEPGRWLLVNDTRQGRGVQAQTCRNSIHPRWRC